MLGSEVLCEFNTRLCDLEARLVSIARTLNVLDGTREVFSLNTCGVSSSTNKVDESIAEYMEQQIDVLQEIDNLKAARLDVIKMLERLDDKQRAVLSVMYLEGGTCADAARRLGVSRQTAYGYHDAGVAILDGMSDWVWNEG